MKTLLHWAAALVVLLLLSGCPYLSDVPIDPTPQIATDKSFEGKWINESELENEHPSYFEIKVKDANWYILTQYSYNSEKAEYDPSSHEAYFSTVKGLSFLNMKMNSDEWQQGYRLYKVEMVGKDHFKLFEVTDNIDEKFDDSKKLRKFIEKNMSLSFFYNSGEQTFVRQ